MKVIAAELGDRPAILTKARRFAPEGLKLLADTLGRFEFADAATAVLDWDNVLGLQPEEVAIPVIVVEAYKRVYALAGPNNVVRTQIRLDVEDLFGNDNVTAEQLVDTVESMRESMDRTIAIRVNN